MLPAFLLTFLVDDIQDAQGRGRAGGCVVAHKFRYCVCAQRAENGTYGTDLRELTSTVGATQR
jgi:hypothetical protein